MSTRLTTTSYAVLGLLAVRSWTSYELAQQMKRSLDYCWPVSERSAYDQPHRLVAAGFAECAVETGPSGERQRFHITEQGKLALREWLATEPSPPRIENEAQLRLTFADSGGRDQLIYSLRSMRTAVLERAARGRVALDDYRATGGPFPHRLHLIALFADLETRLQQALVEWADDAIAEVETWSSTDAPEHPDRVAETLDRIASRHDSFAPGGGVDTRT